MAGIAGIADMAENNWKWLEMTGIGWDGLERLEMAERSWEWQERTGNGYICWILKQMAGKGLKWLLVFKATRRDHP